MANITLRSVKSLPLTNEEVDANFNAINQELVLKATQVDLDNLENSLQDDINTLEDYVNTQIATRIANEANSVTTNNLGSGIVTPPKISQVSANWTFVGTVSVTGNITLTSGISATSFSGGSGSFTTLNSSGNTVLGPTAATSINNTPIGQTIPQAGSFTTLNSSSGITGNLTGNVIGLGTLSAGSTVVTPDVNDNSTKIASTAYVQGANKNSQGRKTLSTSTPSGGSNGDLWYQY